MFYENAKCLETKIIPVLLMLMMCVVIGCGSPNYSGGSTCGGWRDRRTGGGARWLKLSECDRGPKFSKSCSLATRLDLLNFATMPPSPSEMTEVVK